MRLEPVVEALPAGFDQLWAESGAEGHHFLDRLASDWTSGVMRFDRPGEMLLAAYSDDMLVAVGGITVDPEFPEALRMRRFYIRSVFRRAGIGRARRDPAGKCSHEGRYRHAECGDDQFSVPGISRVQPGPSVGADPHP